MSFATRSRRVSAAAVAVGTALLAAPHAASAASAPVSSSSLSWTQYKVYNAAPERTWLGYLARVGTPGNPNGGARAIAPGTGPTVDPSTDGGTGPSFTPFTWQIGGTSGTYDTDTGIGKLAFDGGVEFFGPDIGLQITVNDPTVELNGLTGVLKASGVYTGGTMMAPTILPYTDQQVFTLDLSSAAIVLRADGSRDIAGIVPTVAVTGLPFPSNYVAGVSGPDRTPNNFGSFALRIKPGPQPVVEGPQGPKGDAGPAGPKGATTTIRRYVAYLRKAPYRGKRSNKVTLRRNGKVVATGSIRGRVLRVDLASSVKSLSGRYTIRLSGGSKRSTTIAIG